MHQSFIRISEAESSSEERECPSPVGGGILRRQGSTNSRGSNKVIKKYPKLLEHLIYQVKNIILIAFFSFESVLML